MYGKHGGHNMEIWDINPPKMRSIYFPIKQNVNKEGNNKLKKNKPTKKKKNNTTNKTP